MLFECPTRSWRRSVPLTSYALARFVLDDSNHGLDFGGRRRRWVRSISARHDPPSDHCRLSSEALAIISELVPDLLIDGTAVRLGGAPRVARIDPGNVLELSRHGRGTPKTRIVEIGLVTMHRAD